MTLTFEIDAPDFLDDEEAGSGSLVLEVRGVPDRIAPDALEAGVRALLNEGFTIPGRVHWRDLRQELTTMGVEI